jgi:hypothetical protein
MHSLVLHQGFLKRKQSLLLFIVSAFLNRIIP